MVQNGLRDIDTPSSNTFWQRFKLNKLRAKVCAVVGHLTLFDGFVVGCQIVEVFLGCSYVAQGA